MQKVTFILIAAVMLTTLASIVLHLVQLYTGQ